MRISDWSSDVCSSDLMTGDAQPGAIVELRSWDDARGNRRLSLATRSDLPLADQVTAAGATWLDRQLIAREPVATGSGFGADIRDAMEARAREMEAAGLARRQGSGFRLERNLIETLRAREIDAATDAIARRTGLTRTEEHTSELQSLMRISYAGF